MSAKLWHLKHCSVFDGLSPDRLRQIEARSRFRSFPAANPIYLPADAGHHVFLLAKGLVKVSHLTDDGKESILAFVEEGELFGERAMFDSGQRDELVTTVDASTVVMIPTDEMHRLMAEKADVAWSITKIVGLRRKRIEQRLKNLLFYSNRERLIHLLLDLAEQFGLPTEGGIQLRIKLSHQELANLIGSTRETVTVILGRLKTEGQIDSGRRKIVLTRPDRLAGIVGRLSPVISPLGPRPEPVFAMC